MSKRFFILIGLMITVFALAACGGPTPSDAVPTEMRTETAVTEATASSRVSTETETAVATETEEAETEEATETSRAVSFSNDVWPILQANCSGCHGGSGGLSLASYDSLMAGGRSGAVIIPGNAEDSRLVQYVRSGRMPRGSSRLSDAEVQIIVDWVNAGAPNNGSASLFLDCRLLKKQAGFCARPVSFGSRIIGMVYRAGRRVRARPGGKHPPIRSRGCPGRISRRIRSSHRGL
jgi:mono/diheme cytochrome c family protein